MWFLWACAGDPTDTEIDRSDGDGDGWGVGKDCDDADPTVHPYAKGDVCDGVDQDCDGELDEEPDLVWYPDRDHDGFGRGEGASRACVAPEGFVANDTDCDDDDAGVFPGAAESCDDRDEDCDGLADDGVTPPTWYRDADGDSLGSPDVTKLTCLPDAAGWVTVAGDCDDADPGNPVWVSAEFGTATGNGSLDRPFLTLQAGVDANVTGCVYVAAGEYDESVVIDGRAPVIYGVEGAARTTVRPLGGPTFWVNATAGPVALAGLTLSDGNVGQCVVWDRNGDGTDDTESCGGGAVYQAGGELYLLDVTLADNRLLPETGGGLERYGVGAGVYIGAGTFSAEGVRCERNAARSGACFYQERGTTLAALRTTFADGEATFGPALVNLAATTYLQAAVVRGNTSDGGDGAFHVGSEGAFYLWSATLFDNGVGLACDGGGSVDVRSVVAVQNDLALHHEDGSCTILLDYVGLWDNLEDARGVDLAGSPNVVRGDPLFISDEDLHLSPTSPFVDAGPPGADWRDVDGTRADLGAYGGPEGGW